MDKCSCGEEHGELIDFVSISPDEYIYYYICKLCGETWVEG